MPVVTHHLLAGASITKHSVSWPDPLSALQQHLSNLLPYSISHLLFPTLTHHTHTTYTHTLHTQHIHTHYTHYTSHIRHTLTQQSLAATEQPQLSVNLTSYLASASDLLFNLTDHFNSTFLPILRANADLLRRHLEGNRSSQLIEEGNRLNGAIGLQIIRTASINCKSLPLNAIEGCYIYLVAAVALLVLLTMLSSSHILSSVSSFSTS